MSKEIYRTFHKNTLISAAPEKNTSQNNNIINIRKIVREIINKYIRNIRIRTNKNKY